jgi:hypothetical protein
MTKFTLLVATILSTALATSRARPMFPHRCQFLNMSLIRKMRTSTARSAASAEAAKRLQISLVRIKRLA